MLIMLTSYNIGCVNLLMYSVFCSAKQLYTIRLSKCCEQEVLITMHQKKLMVAIYVDEI